MHILAVFTTSLLLVENFCKQLSVAKSGNSYSLNKSRAAHSCLVLAGGSSHLATYTLTPLQFGSEYLM